MENALFSKKVSKKFGQFEKSVYLCTRKSDNEELNGSVAQLNRASTTDQKVVGLNPAGITKKQRMTANGSHFSFKELTSEKLLLPHQNGNKIMLITD